jgi:hypothetical protein
MLSVIIPLMLPLHAFHIVSDTDSCLICGLYWQMPCFWFTTVMYSRLQGKTQVYIFRSILLYNLASEISVLVCRNAEVLRHVCVLREAHRLNEDVIHVPENSCNTELLNCSRFRLLSDNPHHTLTENRWWKLHSTTSYGFSCTKQCEFFMLVILSVRKTSLFHDHNVVGATHNIIHGWFDLPVRNCFTLLRWYW